jgi:three-Cys-motif partner protein
MDNTLFPLPPSVPKTEPKLSRPIENPVWTGCKAELIARYLKYFVYITKHGTYIDGFAGPQRKNKVNFWSAKLVIESRPRWLRHFRLFELDPESVQMLRDMVGVQPPPDKEKSEPKRSVEVIQGNVNQTLPCFLNASPILSKEATFCLLDQRTFECDWATVQTVAAHKSEGNKIEIFYFFPEGWLHRSVAGMKINKEERMEKWWGSKDWRKLLDLDKTRRSIQLCERFKNELGFKYAVPFPIYGPGRRKVYYYMIHASDHDEATKLMARAYRNATVPESEEQIEMFMSSFLGKRSV